MSRIMRSVVEFLDSAGWKYWQPSRSQVHQVLLFAEAEHNHWVCVIEAREAAQQVQVRALFPARVPRERVCAALEYIAAANPRLVMGSLTLDVDVGSLTYTIGVGFERIVLTPGLIRPLVEHTILTADRHLPGLMRVVCGAVRHCEAHEHMECYTIEEMIDLADDWLQR
jgi:hypothetical protein